MLDTESKKERYRHILETISRMGVPKEVQGEKRDEYIAKTIEVGEKLCQKMEKIFNASQDAEEQTFLAFEIGQILKQIKVLKGETIGDAILFIMASNHAFGVIEH